MMYLRGYLITAVGKINKIPQTITCELIAHYLYGKKSFLHRILADNHRHFYVIHSIA